MKKMTGEAKDRLLSLLKRGGEYVSAEALPYFKKQKLSCDYLKKVLLQECGEELIPEPIMEGLVQKLVCNIAFEDEEGLFSDVHETPRLIRSPTTSALGSQHEGELTKP